MYKPWETIEIAGENGHTVKLGCETAAVVRQGKDNYYFDCGKCKCQSIGDDTGTQWDCNNYIPIESAQRTKTGRYKQYCVNYIREGRK